MLKEILATVMVLVTFGSLPVMADTYVFRLENFRIAHTRSPDKDTVHIALAVKAGNGPLQEKIYHVPGDKDDGTYPIGVELGPFNIDSQTPVVINYQLHNIGG